eukprot:TRINITY_DN14146_c0_g1_i2.p1 TRINITY_DN14146_c0_g1~~TRINITY_DN14146_c0_g1_i2.p1  ORF type:complete len:572 (-),score=98.23 TRINITY_DN14146_c0_g1_i2:76-1791(-)
MDIQPRPAMPRGVSSAPVKLECEDDSVPNGDESYDLLSLTAQIEESLSKRHEEALFQLKQLSYMAKRFSKARCTSYDDTKIELADSHGELGAQVASANGMEDEVECKEKDSSGSSTQSTDQEHIQRKGQRIASITSRASSKIHEVLDSVESAPCCHVLRKKRQQKLQKAQDAKMVGAGLFRDHFKESNFDAFIGFVILLNIVVMFLQLQWEGQMAGIQLNLAPSADYWHGAGGWFDVLAHLFNAIFLIEFIIRVSKLRLRYFMEVSHVFDFLLVAVSSVELYILQPLQVGLGANVTMLRFLRFFKLFRVLRVVRVMKLFRELRVLVQTIASSLVGVAWSMVLMGMMIVASSLILCQLLLEFVMDDTKNVNIRKWVWLNYGSSTRATYTMFEATFSGCWPDKAKTLVDDISPMYSLFWIFYIAGGVFAVTRIIGAAFVKEALNVASQQSDLMVYERMRNKEVYLKKLREFFVEADQSGDGMVDREEFDEIMSNPRVLAFLQALELEVHETHSLFNLLEDGAGQISCDDFLQGVVRLKGQARCVDVVAVLRDVSRISQKLDKLHRALGVDETP